jgi:DNA invertase Pin-like site-specific DNA recombinase
MAQLRLMMAGGDKTVVWDPQKLEEANPEALAAVQEAERIFNEERARGATAFKVEAGKPAERLDNFDKTAEQTILVPRVAGG